MDTVTTPTYSVHLDFAHPCKEVIYFFQKEAYRIDVTGKYNNDYFSVFYNFNKLNVFKCRVNICILLI